MDTEMKFWDKKTGLRYPNGKEVSPKDVFAEFPFTSGDSKVIIEVMPDGAVGAIDNLAILEQVYNITDKTLTDEQKLAKIIELRNTPPAPVPTGTNPDELRADVDYLLMLQGEG